MRRGCVIRFHSNGNGVVGTAEQRDERQSEGVATGRKDRDREREGGKKREEKREWREGKRLRGHQLLGSASQSAFRLTFSKLSHTPGASL